MRNRIKVVTDETPLQYLRSEPKAGTTVLIERRGKQPSNAKPPRFYEPSSSQWWRNGVAPLRDGSKEACYQAERAWSAGNANDAAWCELNQHTDGILGAARFIRDVISSGWFKRRFPKFSSCTVQYSPQATSCWAGPIGAEHRGMNYAEITKGRIIMSSWGLRHKWVLLHELAHAVLPGCHSHDRRWRRVYIDLIGYHFGAEQRKKLIAEYRIRRISFAPHTARAKMTRERRAQLRQQLANARLVRKNNADLRSL